MNASSSLLLQSNDSVEGKCAAFDEVPCFLPVVPKTTSCNPDLFQQIEYRYYPHVKGGTSPEIC